MPLTKAAQKVLGQLANEATKTVAEVVRERGGNASNVRKTGHWSNKSLGEAAEAAAAGDESAKTAVKIAKQADRLGQKY